ncbi:glutamate--tRNA ligase, partial [Tamlana crocina]|nr:glutamate--tRNA ligase [Tamlana crocina]
KYDEKAAKKVWKEDTSAVMDRVIEILEKENDFSAANLQEKVKGWLTSEGIGFGKVMQPFRLSLVGAMQGPDVFEIAATIGKEETLSRVKKAQQSL